MEFCWPAVVLTAALLAASLERYVLSEATPSALRGLEQCVRRW